MSEQTLYKLAGTPYKRPYRLDLKYVKPPTYTSWDPNIHIMTLAAYESAQDMEDYTPYGETPINPLAGTVQNVHFLDDESATEDLNPGDFIYEFILYEDGEAIYSTQAEYTLVWPEVEAEELNGITGLFGVRQVTDFPWQEW